MATSASTLQSHCEFSEKDEQNSVSPINKKYIHVNYVVCT